MSNLHKKKEQLMKNTTRLRQLVLDREILVLPGAYDALSARIIENTGFEALVVGGFATSAVRLGRPDLGLLGLSEMVDHARRIVDAVTIPVFADGDTGHGNVGNVQRTIRDFERAGVAGLFIEDQVFPKRCGHMDGKEVIAADEMIDKIKAAVDSRSDSDFVIMARTDALAVRGITEAIDRGNRYREAGADIIFVEALTTIDEMKQVARSVDAPLFASAIEGGKTPLFSVREFHDLGFSVVAYGLSALFAAAYSTRMILETLRATGTTKGMLGTMTVFDEFNRLVGLDLT